MVISSMNEISIPDFNKDVFKPKQHEYCMLIPLLNEGDRFRSQVEKMKAGGIFDIVDVIICDAGSTDGATESSYLEQSGFRALLTRQGKGRYSTDIKMGYYWAIEQGYKGFITVDGNDKDDTSATKDFVKALEQGFDYVQGSRFIKGGKGINTPFVRQVAMRFINEPIMSLCSKRHLTDTTNGYRAYSSKFLTDQRVKPFRDVFYGYELIYYLPVTACNLGFKVTEIPVIRAYPDSGEVPSKIGGIRGNIYQLSILWKIITKQYNIK